jgi:hypothetical protein
MGMFVQQVPRWSAGSHYKQIQICPAVITAFPMHARDMIRRLKHFKAPVTSKVTDRKTRVVQVHCSGHPGAASPQCWAQGLRSAILSASMLLSPVMMPPATTATGMEGSMLQMKAPEGTAAAE